MKYQNYLLSAAILLLGACSSENAPLVEKTNQLVKVSFNIELEPEIIPFSTQGKRIRKHRKTPKQNQ